MTHGQEQSELAYVPIIGEQAGLEGFPAIYAGVQAALPSAPERLQALIAGASFLRPNPSARDDLEYSTIDHITAESLIAARYSTENPSPYGSLETGSSNKYWKSVAPYLVELSNNIPDFCRPLVFDDDKPTANIADIIRQPACALPNRNPDAFPQRVLTVAEIRTGMNENEAARKAFWETAVVEQWDEVAERAHAAMVGGKITVISGPRGIGKSNQLLPRLASTAEAEGRIVRKLVRASDLDVNDAIVEADGQPFTLLLDEPQLKEGSIDGTATELSLARLSGHDIQTAIVFGAIDEREQRKNIAQRFIVEPLEDVNLQVQYEELTADPLISTASVQKLAEVFKSDQSMIDFICKHPYLRIPRVFDATVFGIITDPRDDGTYEDEANMWVKDVALGSYARGLTRGHTTRAVLQPRSKEDIVQTLTADNNMGDIHQLPRFIDEMAANIGASKDQAYVYYRQLCESLEIDSQPEDQLFKSAT